ncbi:hypothetical protein B296_00025745 [Ensete ventricosum]|uniref:Histidine kinase domain-containing protein n=1 Tax=Ensete ventricosum TaxID=4639 RepID=A0A426ZUH0_ENSVE|nr:hypothetical protein B296_00025745 [Ensete ventricosum]
MLNGLCCFLFFPIINPVLSCNIAWLIYLRITHTGSGVPDLLLSEMFGTSEDPSEEGLGLLVCRKLLRLMNGDVRYLREAGKSGFIVSVELASAPKLGEAEKAILHYKLARHESASSEDIAQVNRIQSHLSKCSEGRNSTGPSHLYDRKLRVLVLPLPANNSRHVPTILAANAEALLALGRQEEAETTLDSASKFDIDAFTKLFGSAKTAHQLSI